MTTKLLDLSDKGLWHTYLNRILHKDIYFTPEYCEIHELNGEGKAQLFIYEDGEDFVCYPFMLREVSELPYLHKYIAKYGVLYDISTPYGYGGPLTNVQGSMAGRSLLRKFWEAFDEYCERANIISEFIRFHPLLQNQLLYPDTHPLHIRDTIHVELTKEYEDIWANYDTKNRNRIRKAKKNELRIVHRPLDELDDFMDLYYSTMKKNGAREYYYFSKDFFEQTCKLLKGNAELIEVVTPGGKTIMSALFMCGEEFVHYHLSGSDSNHSHLGANNLLLDYTVKWARERGYKSLHLGGGYTGNDDSLFRFKRIFNKHGELPFYIGKQIHNRSIYEELASEIGKGLSDYFPIYRHPDLLVSTSEGSNSVLARH